MNTRFLAIQIINRVFETGSYADILLDVSFKKHKLSSRDRAFTTELVFGTLRWLGRLDWSLQKVYTSDWLKLPLIVRRSMEIGLYQILYMDRVPDHASVNESVKIVIQKKGMVWGRVVNGVLREIIRSRYLIKPPDMKKDPVEALSVAWSHPRWLVQKWMDTFGVKRTESICRADNERPELGIRINALRADRQRILEDFKMLNKSVRLSDYFDEFLLLKSGSGVFDSDQFLSGFFSAQDVSAGLVAYLMDVKPGETVLDMASAPGGKATHMAELCRDKADIVAADTHPMRIGKVKENVIRLGLNRVYPVVADGRKCPVRETDKVLIDAPCSGIGVIRRRGELRWKLTPDQLPGRIKLQKDLLETGARILKPGGVLVYSTCSMLPEENSIQVEQFLSEHKNFTLENAKEFVNSFFVNEEGMIETWTDMHHMDGSFAARIRKTG